jgi:molybdenum cofactor cytidylyltransferase
MESTPPGQAGKIGAVILAAGQSRRMGRPKLVLPWQGRTVIEQVVRTLIDSQVAEIVVVTGGARAEVARALESCPVRLADNPDYARSEMTTSLQVGIRALPAGIRALLVVLGDQPAIERGVVERLIAAYHSSPARLIIPSYQRRRGHPWLVEASLWPGLLALSPDQTLRDFLHTNEGEIAYIETNSPGILKDMDTPEDYERLKKHE